MITVDYIQFSFCHISIISTCRFWNSIFHVALKYQLAYRIVYCDFGYWNNSKDYFNVGLIQAILLLTPQRRSRNRNIRGCKQSIVLNQQHYNRSYKTSVWEPEPYSQELGLFTGRRRRYTFLEGAGDGKPFLLRDFLKLSHLLIKSQLWLLFFLWEIFVLVSI